MRPLKWLLIAAGGLVVALLLGVVVLTQWVDPAVFKPRIVAALETATGRPVSLPGELRLSWYPWLALRTGAGTVGNPPGFDGPPLLRWGEAHFGARLLPLLRGEFELDRIRLVGVDAQLRRDAAGRGNWESLGNRAGGTDSPASGAGAGAGAGPAVQPFTLAGLDLQDARVSYRDAATGARWDLDSLELSTGAWPAGPTSPVEVKAGFELKQGGQPLLGEATLQTRVQISTQRLQFEATRFAARIFNPSLAAEGVPVSLELPAATIDLQPPAARITSLRVAIGKTPVELRALTVEQPADAPLRAAVELKLEPTSLRGLLDTLGIKPPVTTDPGVLTSFSVDARMELREGTLQIEPLTVVLDQTRFSGRVRRLGEPPLFEFALSGDQMNLDRYVEPDSADSEPFRFPRQALAALRARGTLTLERASYDGITAEGLEIKALIDEAAPPASSTAAPTAPSPGRQTARPRSE